MTKEEMKIFIEKEVAGGVDLSHIQTMLAEKGCKMTYMELRLLAAEIADAQWTKLDKPDKVEKVPEKNAAPENLEEEELPADEPESEAVADDLPGDDVQDIPDNTPSPEDDSIPAGKTTVELSKLVKPGAVANGSVSFGSGATADWYLDQYGRVGLANASGKPTRRDVQEFQTELQKLLGGM